MVHSEKEALRNHVGLIAKNKQDAWTPYMVVKYLDETPKEVPKMKKEAQRGVHTPINGPLKDDGICSSSCMLKER